MPFGSPRSILLSGAFVTGGAPVCGRPVGLTLATTAALAATEAGACAGASVCAAPPHAETSTATLAMISVTRRADLRARLNVTSTKILSGAAP